MLGVQMFPGYDDFNPRSPDGERLQSSLIAGLRDEISIHAPRMGSDNITTATAAANNAFQSTLPGWGATGRILGHGFPVGISIHAPRMGSDASTGNSSIRHSTFQSTLPGWGATTAALTIRHHVHDFNPRSPDGERLSTTDLTKSPGSISIHAPRMGSDSGSSPTRWRKPIFQSTLPGWGAT